ncbi:hypothetical protein ACFFWD_36435 [Bradyrhizobium erythrophlei]|uniref:hypothetical protein n=1 Tax=Bradyrhizobium erythrophlei TaxID=1437360 RepID=UPI0035E861C3
MRRWRKFSDGSTQRWDLGVLALILAILLTGILAKLNQAWWAILIVLVLCALLAGLRRGSR